MNQNDTKWIAVPEQGNFFKLEDNDLYYSPMLQDGTMEIDEDDDYNIAQLSAHAEGDIQAIFSSISTALDRTISEYNLDY
jgi:hypothetical protein